MTFAPASSEITSQQHFPFRKSCFGAAVGIGLSRSMHCGKTADSIEMPFRVVDPMGPRNDGVRPLLIIVVERDYLRGTIVWSHL